LDGALCPTNYYPPIPSPPGTFLSEDRIINPCTLGEYCPPGFSLSHSTNRSMLLCPGGYTCQNPYVIQPKTCYHSYEINNVTYCPPGSYTEQLCPPGTYCHTNTESINCSSTQYCPSGTFAARPCKAGYYCPTQYEEIPCPKRHYCQTGFTKAEKVSLSILFWLL
jgi:hypothetical protein